MNPLYGPGLAYIQADGFGDFARAAAPWILKQLRAAGVRHVVEVGCGAGPLTAELVRAGFNVTAIDPSPALLDFARTAAPPARFIEGSAYEVQLPPCDAVLAIGEPLTYHDDAITAESKLRDFFNCVSLALSPAGLLIFDLIETGTPPLDNRFWSSREDWVILGDTREDTAQQTLTRNIEFFLREGEHYRRGHELHRVRLFDSSQVIQWLNDGGFKVESTRSYGGYPLPPRRQAFIARRGARP